MASPRNLQQGIQLSLSAISNAWGCARETAKKRLDSAGIRPAGQNRGHYVYDLKDVVRAFAEAQQGDFDPDRLPPFERKAYYQAEHEKLKLQVERGELLSRIEVEMEFARMFEIVGRFLDTLPDRLERDGSATPAQLQRIEELMDQMREELYQEIQMGADDGADSAVDAAG